MAGAPFTLSPDYWQTFSLGRKDLEFLSTHLFENEIPLNEAELVPILVEERIRANALSWSNSRNRAAGSICPENTITAGEKLVFPALNWKKGKVISARPSVNPTLGEFEVIEVAFEGEDSRLFAAGLADHKLNRPVEISADDQLLNPANILKSHGPELEQKLTAALLADKALVQVAGRWFPRALLVDVNVGHLNLAEAVLDEAGGKPLPTKALIEQLDLSGNVNPKLIEFSLNFALQEDGRFDEVGPAGEVLWFLKRLEPEDVRQIPAPLRYTDIPYDRSHMNQEMLALESELDDELAEGQAASARSERSGHQPELSALAGRYAAGFGTCARIVPDRLLHPAGPLYTGGWTVPRRAAGLGGAPAWLRGRAGQVVSKIWINARQPGICGKRKNSRAGGCHGQNPPPDARLGADGAGWQRWRDRLCHAEAEHHGRFQ